MESKSAANDRLVKELSDQHQTITALRKQVNEQSDKIQAAETAAVTAKYREQALQQELDRVKQSSQWCEDELRQREQANTKYRKEKSARLAELEHQYDDATLKVEALRRTETTLRNQISDLNQKAEDALTRVRTLQEEASKKNADLQIDLDGSRRLYELTKQGADRTKTRVEELTVQLNQARQDAGGQIGQLQAELDSERASRETAEARVVELEAKVETLEGQSAMPERNSPFPITPRRGVNGIGSVRTPRQLGSPVRAASPSSSRAKFGRPSTPVGDEPDELATVLSNEKKKSARLRAALDGALRQLDAIKPDADQLRYDYDRLTADKEELEKTNEGLTVEREKLRKDCRHWEGQATGLAREAELLHQQIRDLGLQLKVMLMEVEARNQGLEALGTVSQAQLDQVIRGELEEAQVASMTASNQLITRRLVIFRNISELQEKNADLLKLTRKFSEDFESEEAKVKRNENAQLRTELEQLKDRNVTLEERSKSVLDKSGSTVRERNMLRKLLAKQGRISLGPDGGVVLDQSHLDSPTPRAQSVETIESQQLTENNRLLREVQSSFDAFRNEAIAERSSLKEQVGQLSREKSEIHRDLTRIQGELQVANGRYDILQTNYKALKAEHEELQKHSLAITESATKQDFKSQQTIEEIAEAKSIIESLKSETTTLKTEREVWKKVETRLKEHNQNIEVEHVQLNQIIANQQDAMNRREASNADARRELQVRADKLDTELQSTKRKLDNEIEESRQAARRHEHELQQARNRIDEQNKLIGSLREELLPVKTQRDQLQSRVDELRTELRAAEDKVQALQPRSSARTRNIPVAEPSNADDEDEEEEEDLEYKILELEDEIKSRDRVLEIKNDDLLRANRKVDSLTARLESAEEALQGMEQDVDQYREQMESLLTERDGKSADLQKRVDEISTELANASTELSQLRTKEEESLANFNEQKAQLESELTRLRDDKDRLQETAKLLGEDVKAQAEIARQAQNDYERELGKHTEAINNLQAVRTELNTLKTQAVTYKSQAEAAKATLVEQQESWDETKNLYERENLELRVSRGNDRDQIKTLLDEVHRSAEELKTLKHDPTFLTKTIDAAAVLATDKNYDDIINYLRREKQIVDIQYDQTVRDLDRVNSTLRYTEEKLERAEEKIRELRSTDMSLQASTKAYNEIMEKIKEMNLLRESNETLRNQSRRFQEKYEETKQEVEELQDKLIPLEAKLVELEADIEYKDEHLKLLEKDRDHWQQRTHDVMHKYQRIDPEELEGLKTTISTLQAERDQLVADKQGMQEEIDGIGERIRLVQEQERKDAEERMEKMREQARQKNREQNNRFKEKAAELESVAAEKEQLAAQHESVRVELEATKAARDEALAKIQSINDTANTTTLEEGQVADDEASRLSAEERASLEAQLAEAKKVAAELSARNAELESQAQSLQAQLQELQTRLQEVEGQIASLQDLIQQKDTELAALKEGSAPIATSVTSVEAGEVQPNAAAAADLEAVKQRLEADYKKRADNMKDQFNAKLKTMKDRYRNEVAEEHAAEISRLQQEHESAILRLQEEHQAELERVRQEAASSNAPPTDASNAQPATDSQPQPVTNGVQQAPVDPAILSGEKELAQEHARSLITHQPAFKSLISNNIKKRLDQERDSMKAKAEEEAAKANAQMKEDLEKAKKESENVRTLMEKKAKAQQSIITNARDKFKAQVDVVEQAATQTPQRAVGEVWAIAKSTKPAAAAQPSSTPARPTAPPVSAPQPPATTAQTPQVAPTAPAAATTATQPAAPTTQPQAHQQNPSTAAPTVPTPLQQVPNATDATQRRPPNAMQELRALSAPAQRQNQNQGTGPPTLRNLITTAGGQQSQTGIPRPGAPRGGRGGNRGGAQSQGQHPQSTVQEQGGNTVMSEYIPRRRGPPGCESNICGHNNRAVFGCPKCLQLEIEWLANEGSDAGRGRGRGGPSTTTNIPQAPAATPAAGRGAGRGAMNPNAANFAPGGRGSGPAGAGAGGPAAGGNAGQKRKPDDDGRGDGKRARSSE